MAAHVDRTAQEYIQTIDPTEEDAIISDLAGSKSSKDKTGLRAKD